MLSGRTIIITGAARGLGREIARACAEAGGALVLADIDRAGVEETAAQISASGGTARAATVDLRDPASIEALAAGLDAPIHGLVNNGAIATGIGGIAHDAIEIETWDRVMEVNVRGTWLMTRAIVPKLTQPGGRIVNIASDTALWGAPNLLSYTASKGAVMSMTRSLSRELGPKGIGITAIAPGILTTDSTEYVPEARHRLYEDGRAVPGKQPPEDVTGTVVFLLSEAALTLTGQVLPTNRGFVFT
jgi:NAD(P)-dependent dehydrogenase (short-subunit alcohol dehydrogenase family)